MRKTLTLLLCSGSSLAFAQDTLQEKAMDIYGFAMMDFGYNAGAIHPDWFDVMRPTKLPSFKDEFGSEGNMYFGVRQSRLGVKSYTNTPLGELFTQFEFEMFGTGVDAGQTTIRLRHAYGQLGKWGAGQYWSPFMDIDIFPNSVEYWGPCGMAFFRNVQLRFMPIQGDTRLTFAIERPGASADQGPYGSVISAAGVTPRFPAPDFSAEYHRATKFGYVELAGIVRDVEWEDHNDSLDLDGSALCYGLNLTSNIHYGKDKKSTIRFGAVFGQGIQNYMNDATVDIGVRPNEGDARKPIEGYAIPMIGGSLFIDHFWSSKASTTIGYSMLDMDLDDASDSSAYQQGGYGIANIMFYPVPNVMWGAELQYGSRMNFKDDWDYSAVKVQLSFKYNFGQTLYRRKKA
ncbi:MAG TPA: DcaP family trimeric outer membrane transporter [Flavobacteriales bacterium]|nr:DcaP family trimeric outer membrane transporter [Flavobacteriales bacterium]